MRAFRRPTVRADYACLSSTDRASAAPQFGGWLRNSRRLGVSLPVAELPKSRSPAIIALQQAGSVLLCQRMTTLSSRHARRYALIAVKGHINCAVSVLVAACWLPAQQFPSEPSALFRSEAQVVLLSFNVVRDRYFVLDVKPEDLILLQDGKRIQFSSFEGPGTRRRPPLDLALVFDTSPPPKSQGNRLLNI